MQWDTNYIFLIMEYCSGGDLSNFIRSRNTLAEVEAKYFLQQLGTFSYNIFSPCLHVCAMRVTVIGLCV